MITLPASDVQSFHQEKRPEDRDKDRKIDSRGRIFFFYTMKREPGKAMYATGYFVREC